MAQRIRRQFVSFTFAALCALYASFAEADTNLVKYDFDYGVLNSGPDTYQIFQHKNSKAEISNAYASGGYASAHFTDHAHDGDFVELQGYFPEQTSGVVRFRFKFLIAGQSNLFNVALAGKDRYQLSPLGIQFWLIYEDGWLKHKSDSIPKKLFQPNLYEWYGLDALLDLNKGSYSLRIARENGAVAVELKDQQFAAGASNVHSLKEYSFIGDLADSEAADFYIDDILIDTSNNTELPKLVAPGRRKYFYEIWDDYHRETQGELRCLPANSLIDFGISSKEYAAIADRRQLEVLDRLTRETPNTGDIEQWESSNELSAVVDWINACKALDKRKTTAAQASIKLALQKMPHAYLYQLTAILIDATSSSDVAGLYNRIYGLPSSGNEIRNQIALAMISFHAQKNSDVDHGRTVTAALQYLDRLNNQDASRLASLGLQPVNNDYIERLQRFMPESWEGYLQWMLVLEQHYYSELWQGRYREAYSLATQIVTKLARRSIAPGIWLERQADGAFLNHDLETALDLYNLQATRSYSSVLKMSDLYHMQGDLESERTLRESIYKNFTRRP